MRKKVTLSLDDSTYESFRKYCDAHDIQLSKRIERLIKEELKDQRFTK